MLLYPSLWINFAPSLYVNVSSMPWVFIFFVLKALHANVIIKDICMSLILLPLSKKLCVNHHLKIWERTEVLQLQLLYPLIIICTFPIISSLVHENVLKPYEFFRTKLEIYQEFDQNSDSSELIEIQTQVTHTRLLQSQIPKPNFPFICNFISAIELFQM